MLNRIAEIEERLRKATPGPWLLLADNELLITNAPSDLRFLLDQLFQHKVIIEKAIEYIEAMEQEPNVNHILQHGAWLNARRALLTLEEK